ncbi:MAG: aminotransferase class IV [Bacteroidia bacterium]
MHICYNGDFFPYDQAIFKINNRSFLYGDGLFESIRIANGKILFLADHLERLKSGMKLLHLNITKDFNVEYFTEKINQLAIKNNSGDSSRIKLNVFRNEGGLYAPTDDNISFTISINKNDENKYILNTAGLFIELFTEIKKNVNVFSSFKTCNSLIYVLAGIWKNKNSLDDCLLLNESDRLCEGLSSNVFLVKNNHFFTPEISEGCIKGVMRGKIIELLQAQGISFSEEKLEIKDLMNAEEVFLTNASTGIRWVGAFRNKRYFSKYSKEIVSLLNNHIINNG